MSNYPLSKEGLLVLTVKNLVYNVKSADLLSRFTALTGMTGKC